MFFVTVPFGAIAALILALKVRESVARKPALPLDWPGAALLAGGSSALLLAVLGGESGRGPLAAALLLAAAAALLVLFVRWERQAPDPVLPLDLLTQPAIAAAILGSLILGAVLFGIDTYIPLYVQGVRGGTATQAGRTITPLFLSWSISVAVAAKVVLRFGFRATAMIGTALIAAGSAALVTGAGWPALAGPTFLAGMIVVGSGMGPASLSQILSVQDAVAWNRRGVATGAVTFFRTIGGALGVGALGAVLGYALARRLAGAVGVDITAALRPETHGRLASDQLRAVQAALGASLREVFLLMLALALVGLVCAARLPRGHDHPAPNEATPDDEGVLVGAAEV